jgi:hypothetical protein
LAQSLPNAQATQRAPPLPHAALALPGWQLPLPSQQPLAQLVASHWHTPLTHSCPARHAQQAAPSAPQKSLVFPGSQVAPLQQPLGQSPALQYAMHA